MSKLDGFLTASLLFGLLLSAGAGLYMASREDRCLITKENLKNPESVCLCFGKCEGVCDD